MGVWDEEDAEEWGGWGGDCAACGAGAGGEKALAAKPGTFGRGFMEWAALRLPLPWPHGVKTMPEMDQEIGGTTPTEFEGDMRELRRLFERFTREPRDFAWRPHPIFLGMSEEEGVRGGDVAR